MTTPTHTLVVTAHPDPSSLTHQLASEIRDRLAAWGPVEIADLAAEGFDPRFSAEDRATYLGRTGTASDVALEQARVDRASDLVLVFPVFWWSMPALLKGWIDRVFVNGWAFDLDPEEGVRPRLGHLTTHLVPVAASDQALYDRHGYEQAIRTQIVHGIVEYCGSRAGASPFVHDSEDPAVDVRRSSADRALDTLVADFTRRYGPRQA